MLRNNAKLKFPWTGSIEEHESGDYYMIRDRENSLVTIIPPHTVDKDIRKIGNFIVRATNNTNIKDHTLDHIENMQIGFGFTIFALVVVNILLDIDYSPMLILAGGFLVSAAQISYTRMKIKRKQENK